VVRRTHYNVLFIHTLPNLLIFITLFFIFREDAALYNNRYLFLIFRFVARALDININI